MALTMQRVRSLEFDPKRPDRVEWDSIVGFGVRIRRNGIKSYVAVYRDRSTGMKRKMTLGRVDRVPLSLARKEARKLLAQAALGKDPARERTDTRRGITVSALAEKWLQTVELKSSTRTLYNWCLNAAILPAFGKKPARSVTARDIRAFYNGIKDGGNLTKANRTLAVLSSMFSWACRRDILPANVAAGAIHRSDRAREQASTRYLSEDETARFIAACETLRSEGGHHGRVATGFLVMLLCALRPSEVFRLRWDEIDATAGVIRLREQKAGNGVVHLRGPALALLRSLEQTHGTWIFPSPRRDGPAESGRTVWVKIAALASFDDPQPTAKSLRKTFASLGRSWGFGLETIGPALRHAESGVTGRAYAHADPAVVGQAAESIASRLAGLSAEPAKVIAIKKK